MGAPRTESSDQADGYIRKSAADFPVGGASMTPSAYASMRELDGFGSKYRSISMRGMPHQVSAMSSSMETVPHSSNARPATYPNAIRSSRSYSVMYQVPDQAISKSLATNIGSFASS